jgi:hypothetical protein
VKERPIIFTGEMVHAILSGRKTETRRLKFNAEIGDYLYVRETFFKDSCLTCNDGYDYLGGNYCTCTDPPLYRATLGKDFGNLPPPREIKWQPSILMPKIYARLWLQVTDVRRERLHDITYKGIEAEGYNAFRKDSPWLTDHSLTAAEDAFAWWIELWDSINAGRGFPWDDNPEVVVVEFERIEK